MISLIAIIGTNRAIAINGRQLWHIPDDLARFRKLTTGHSVIMGRKTFDSIGDPLPERTNIVLTRNKKYYAEGCIITHTIEDALSKSVSAETFIIGGGQVYQQTIDVADRLYITLVQESPLADTFFPPYDEFNTVISKEQKKSGDLNCQFLTLER